MEGVTKMLAVKGDLMLIDLTDEVGDGRLDEMQRESDCHFRFRLSGRTQSRVVLSAMCGPAVGMTGWKGRNDV